MAQNRDTSSSRESAQSSSSRTTVHLSARRCRGMPQYLVWKIPSRVADTTFDLEARKGKPVRIFFSHSSRDKSLLRELRGYFPPWITSWIDEEKLLFGAGLDASLQRAIDQDVDYVVLFIGYEALESQWVRREVKWALDRESRLGRVFLLPVLLVDARHRLAEFGIEGRISLEIADFSQGGVKALADKITNHLGGWMSERLHLSLAGSNATNISTSHGELSDTFAAVTSVLARVPAEFHAEVSTLLVRPFLDQISLSLIGRIPLTSSQYYQRILTEMNKAEAGWKILAVSMLVSELWKADVDQRNYAARNLAAVRRGASIHRLFVMPENSVGQFDSALQEQIEYQVHVRIASNRLLTHVPELEDFVLFTRQDGARAYIAHPAIDGSRRIRTGLLDMSENGTAWLREMFWKAWDLAVPAGKPSNIASVTEPQRSNTDAPGLHMPSHQLETAVIGCEEAARARGIPLANELKTLVLQTSHGYVAAHLPGDGILSLRKVKERLEATEAYLADPEDLLSLGLSPGTVCAVLTPIWNLPHLVTRRLLDLTQVMTNDGTRTGYFVFNPAVLVDAPNVTVGDFEK